MAKHEFGIMDDTPQPNKWYDEYEPEKYNCIKVDDEHFERIIDKFNCIDTYWHTLDRPARGIAYCGVTIYPPSSMSMFLTTLGCQNNEAFEPLISLINKAILNQKYIIHFGL